MSESGEKCKCLLPPPPLSDLPLRSMVPILLPFLPSSPAAPRWNKQGDTTGFSAAKLRHPLLLPCFFPSTPLGWEEELIKRYICFSSSRLLPPLFFCSVQFIPRREDQDGKWRIGRSRKRAEPPPSPLLRVSAISAGKKVPYHTQTFRRTNCRGEQYILIAAAKPNGELGERLGSSQARRVMSQAVQTGVGLVAEESRPWHPTVIHRHLAL